MSRRDYRSATVVTLGLAALIAALLLCALGRMGWVR